jgi:O-acetyl-ADP-ribose deacetylase (regulator of RNase III)
MLHLSIRPANLGKNVEFIIHTVGPDARLQSEARVTTVQAPQLASAYRESLTRAKERGLKTVAFPAISVGIFEFPMKLGAKARARARARPEADAYVKQAARAGCAKGRRLCCLTRAPPSAAHVRPALADRN